MVNAGDDLIGIEEPSLWEHPNNRNKRAATVTGLGLARAVGHPSLRILGMESLLTATRGSVDEMSMTPITSHA